MQRLCALSKQSRLQLRPTRLLLASSALRLDSRSFGDRRGVVKWFNCDRGYGFITSEGEDYFVHYSCISEVQGDPSFRSLAQGEQVEFDIDIEAETGRARAMNVTGPGGNPVQGAVRGQTFDSTESQGRGGRFPVNTRIEIQERKSRPTRKFWGRISRGCPGRYPSGRPVSVGQALKTLEILKPSLSVQTSLPKGADIHDGQKNPVFSGDFMLASVPICHLVFFFLGFPAFSSLNCQDQTHT